MKYSIGILIAFLALAQARKISFCYYPEWSTNLKPADIKAEYCTHIGYSFFLLGTDGTCSIKPGQDGFIKELITKKSANTKICPVIGGASLSGNFGGVASNPAAKQQFFKTCGALMQQYGFDNCFDVDWEFPAETERNTFINLLRDIKAGMNGVELFAAVNPGKWQSDISYDIPALASVVDYINVMGYDYHGRWEQTTGMNAPLTGPAGDTLTLEATVNYYLSKGAPANKIVLGVPFYGRTAYLTTSATNVGAPMSDGGDLPYNEICSDKSWVVSRDSTYQVPYAVKGSTWLSFDDPISIAAKMKFINDKGLAGTLIWSIQQDDITGACGGGAWPLLTAVNQGLNGGSVSSPTPSPSPAPAPAPAPVPAPAPTPANDNVFKCPGDGYYVDSQDCHYYHYCMGFIHMGKLSCPSGLVFNSVNPNTYSCDWTSPLFSFCYYPEWSGNDLKPANIKAEYCTHIGYSFFHLGTDGTCSITPGQDDFIKELITKKSANTKICPVIGGGKQSWMFGAVATNPAARQQFVKTCGALMQQYGFDNCFDVDWEFPAATERNGLIDLLKDIKAGMNGVELFAAVAAGTWQADISYDVSAVAAAVDYINVMGYDYHGAWEQTTGMNAPLTGPAGDPYTVEGTVNYYLSKGAPANKIVIGVPFYGRTGDLTTSLTNVGAPMSGGGDLDYNKFCVDKSWVVTRDSTYQVPYAVKGSTWLSFDDPISIATKMKFINDKGLAGALIWSIQQDDVTGACGEGAFPLLNAVYQGLNN